MARIHGRRGRLYVGLASASASAEPVSFLNKWTINFATDKVDVTAFGDNNTTYVSGLPNVEGDFGGFYDDATAQLYTAATDGAARKFYLYPDNNDTAEYFWGTAIFDFNIDGAVDGSVNVSGSFSAASQVQKASA